VGKVGRKSAKSPPGRLPPKDNCLAPAVGHAASVAVRGGDQCFDNLFIAIERIEELAWDFLLAPTVGMSRCRFRFDRANLNLIVVPVPAGGFRALVSAPDK
jgi:hypothetical protein